MKRTTKFKGNPLTLLGTELKVGSTLPNFNVTSTDMADIPSDQFMGKPIVIVAVPSIDTPVCSVEAKRFNKEATSLSPNVQILVVSRDLPFAQKRWCAAEGVERVVTASDYKYRTFAEQFGVLIEDWQLLSRAVFVFDSAGKATYIEYVPEVSDEPNYEPVLTAIKTLN